MVRARKRVDSYLGKWPLVTGMREMIQSKIGLLVALLAYSVAMKLMPYVLRNCDVKLDPTIAKIEEVINGYPGLYRDVLTYLKERIKEVLTGAGATVVVRVYGSDLAVLRSKA